VESLCRFCVSGVGRLLYFQKINDGVDHLNPKIFNNSIFVKIAVMNKIVLLLVFILFNFSCAEATKNHSPEEVYEQALVSLKEAQTLRFDAQITFGNQRVVNHTYKIQRAGYEPHLNYFFYKEMDEVTQIYYKLASLAVVEDHKQRITVFDYGNDRSIPQYLDAYTKDEDNLVTVAKLLEENKDSYVFLGESQIGGKTVFGFELGNRVIWINPQTNQPVKLALNPIFDSDGNLTGQTRLFKYSNIQFGVEVTEETFTHEEKEGYVSSVFGIRAEPLLNSQAKDWTLQDVQGKQVSLSDFKGQNLFIEAWVSSCDHCIASIPKVKQIESEFGDKLKVITVNFDYDLEETKEAIKEHQIPYKVLLGNSQFDKDYDIRSFPSFYVIDKTGKIVYTNRGAITGEKEKELFDALRKLK
jgi:thiol-disulfide isomerase/thioredoxin